MGGLPHTHESTLRPRALFLYHTGECKFEFEFASLSARKDAEQPEIENTGVPYRGGTLPGARLLQELPGVLPAVAA